MPMKLVIPGRSLWDDINEEFIDEPDTVLVIEHSLVSLSKWEAKWHKPFLDDKDGKTTEETIDYIRCMTLTQNVDPSVYDRINSKVVKEIIDYIHNPMTATWFSEDKNKKPESRIITAEVLYYQMIALNIPVEFQKWHLNRLLTLIRVCNEENVPKKKKSRRQILEEQHALNMKRRAAQKAKKAKKR